MNAETTVCRRCGFNNPPGMRFCGGCGAPLGEVAVEEERKRVAVLFADICDFTALVSGGDAEEVKEKIDACLRLIGEQVANYDGVVEKYVGDAVLAVFGVPITREDDAERAVRAALRILEQVRWYGASAGLDIHLRIAVHAGEVIAGQPGGEPGREHGVFGNVLNVASRLEATADPDRIVVSDAVFEKTKAAFDYEKLPGVRVKGIAEDLERYLLVGEKRVREKVRGVRGLNAPMIGRDRELQVLEDAFAAVSQGLGARVVAVVGEPGIGKTRLSEELVRRVQGRGAAPLVLHGRCLGYAGAAAYLPFAGIIKGLADIKDDAAPEAVREKLAVFVAAVWKESLWGEVDPAAVLADMLGVRAGGGAPVNPEQFHEQVVLIWEELCRQVAGQRPVIIIIEDVHWADGASLGVINHLARSLGRARVLLLINSRPADYSAQTAALLDRLATFSNYRRVDLNDLTREESADLIAALLAVERITPRTKELIIKKSGGNPFYVEEIVRLLIEEGIVVPRGDKWTVTKDVEDIDIPSSVEDVLRSRVDHLPRQAKRVIQRAAVVGRNFWLQVVSELMGEPVEEYLEEIERRDLIRRSETSSFEDDLEYVFKHALLHESVYNGVLRRVRRNLHVKTARFIEETHAANVERYLSLIAYHYEMGGMLPQAANYYVRAGAQAAGLYANEDAKRFFARAVMCAGEPSVLLETYRRWGDVCARTGENQEALEKYDAARGYVSSLGEDAELLTRIGDVYERLSQYEKALTYYREAEGRAEGLGFALGRALAAKGMAWVYYLQGDYGQALPHARRAAAILSELRDESREADMARAWAQNVLGAILHQQGKTTESRACYERTLAYYEKHGDLFGVGKTLNNIGTTEISAGDLGAAARYLGRSLEIAEKAGNRFGQAVACCNLGYLNITLGNEEEARGYFERYLKINELIGNRLGDGYAYGGLARLACERGDLEAAADYYRRAAAVYKEVGAASLHAAVMLELAACYGRAGKGDEAAAALVASQAPEDDAGRLKVELSLLDLPGSAPAATEDAALADRVARGAEEMDAESRMETYASLAAYLRRRGKGETADAYQGRARRLADSMAATIPDEAQRRRFYARLERLGIITS